MQTIAFFLVLIGLTSAMQVFQLPRNHNKRQVNYDISERRLPEVSDSGEENEDSYLLPAASSNVLSKKKVNNDLVCSEPGMFADVNNNCQIFHYCVLSPRPFGRGFDLRQYSFFCGNTTIFDQYTLTCQVPEKAIPCEYAPEFYPINRRTQEGLKEVFLHKHSDFPIVNRYVAESKSRRYEAAYMNEIRR